MRHVATLVLVLLAAAAAPQRSAQGSEPSPEGAAFVEVTASRAEAWVGELFTLRLRMGFDPEWFAAHAVRLHAQEMDVPVEVDVFGWPTWLAERPAPNDPDRPRLRFVFGGEAVEGRSAGDEVRAGRTYRLVDLERRLAVIEPGTLALGAPSLRFAWATRFTENALGERVPADRHDAEVHGQALNVTVRSLPREGQPGDFGGAVGRFTLKASVDRTEVWVSAPFRLTLAIEGHGNLETLTPPRPAAPSDFHVFSVEDDHGVTKRTLTYEVAVQASSVKEVPAFALSYFDPGPPARYDTTRSAPIPLIVRSGARVVDISQDGCAAYNVRVPPWTIALTVGVLVGLFAAGWARVRRSRRRLADSPSLARRQAALAALRAAAARPGADLAPAFTEVLAAHLMTPHAAAIGPYVATRLARSGVEAEVAARAAATLERLVAANYGGEPAGAELAAEAVSIAERITPARG